MADRDDPLRRSVDRATNLQRLDLIKRDLDKPQLMRPSSDQYMREQGYTNQYDVPKFAQGGSVDDAKVSIPRSMRPRATPNAEMNAQNKESFLRQISGEPAPAVADVPLKGYANGGMVSKHGSSTRVTCKSKG